MYIIPYFIENQFIVYFNAILIIYCQLYSYVCISSLNDFDKV